MGRHSRSNLGKTPFPTRSRRRRLLLGRLDDTEVGEELSRPAEEDVAEQGEATPNVFQTSETSAFSSESLPLRNRETAHDLHSSEPESLPPTLKDAVARSSFKSAREPHYASHATSPASETLTRRQQLHIDRNTLASIQRLLEGEQPLTWIFAGDQMTVGSPVDDRTRSYSELLAARLRRASQRQTDVIINTAVPGDTSRSLLANLHWRVLRFRPHLVSIMVGLEDALTGEISVRRFQENLEQIAMAVRDHDANLILHTPVCPNDDQTRCRLATYVAAIYEVTEILSVPLLDHWSTWGALETDLRSSLLGEDGILPSADGHQSIADVFSKILRIDARSAEGRSSRPNQAVRSV